MTVKVITVDKYKTLKCSVNVILNQGTGTKNIFHGDANSICWVIFYSAEISLKLKPPVEATWKVRSTTMPVDKIVWTKVVPEPTETDIFTTTVMQLVQLKSVNW